MAIASSSSSSSSVNKKKEPKQPLNNLFLLLAPSKCVCVSVMCIIFTVVDFNPCMVNSLASLMFLSIFRTERKFIVNLTKI